MIPMPETSLPTHLAHAAEQLDRRLRNGDRIHESRAIDQFAVFLLPRNAARAAAELAALGYAVERSRLRLRIILTIGHTGPVDEESTTAFLTETVAVIERHRGVYDGWRARIVPVV